MNYLLDTNAWLRLFQRPDEIPEPVRMKLAGEATLALSPFSLIEVAQKASKVDLGLRISLTRWFDLAMPKDRITLLPITPAIAARAYQLGDDFHGDPADRAITATALEHRLTLVTSDKRLLAHAGLRTLSTR